jgi:hypothetical protein
MNVGRGLFRAWVLVSILWIGAVMLLPTLPLIDRNYVPIMKIKGNPSEETTKIIMGPRTPNFYNYVTSPSAEKLPMEFGRGPAERLTNFRLIDFADGTKLYIPPGYNEADLDYIVEQFEQQRVSRRTSDVKLFGVVPCVVLFVLGCAVLWVGRGFAA